MKKYDLCVRMSYTDKNGDNKTSWENVGMMMENGNGPYILIKPWVNFAGFPREKGRSHLIVSLFEHKENDQRSSRNNEREDFSTDTQDYDPDKIPF